MGKSQDQAQPPNSCIIGTVIEPFTGCKIWIVTRPKELHTYDAFGSTELFRPSFDVEKPNTHLWKVEAFILRLGMQL